MTISRKIVLDRLIAGDDYFSPISETEVLKLLSFLCVYLNLLQVPPTTPLPQNIMNAVTSTQKHRLAVCLDCIHGNKIFPAFHELYDFIQDNQIGNDAPFTSEEITVLQHLTTLFLEKINENMMTV